MLTPAQREALLNRPALAPPDGVHPNMVNPADLATIESGITQLILTTLFVWMRCYTKIWVVKKFLLEDYALLVAWTISAFAFHPVEFLIDMLPLGVHQWDMTVRQLIKHLYYFHIGAIIYSPVMLALKTSIILQIQRIFIPQHSRQSVVFWLTQAFLWLNVLFYSAAFIYQIFACRPVAKAWDVTIQGGHCTNRLLVHVISASINSASDFLLFILPQPGIWKLKLEGAKKWGLRGVFLIAIFGCVFSAIRIHFAVILYHAEDFTYEAARMGKWAEPELTCGFVAACLPVLPRFIRHLRTHSFIPSMLDVFRSRSRTSAPPSGALSTVPTRGSGKKSGMVTDVEFDELVVNRTVQLDEASERGSQERVSMGDRASQGSRRLSMDVTEGQKMYSVGV